MAVAPRLGVGDRLDSPFLPVSIAMAKLTVAEIKRQISALEAKAVRLAAEESKASVARVRSLMDSLGVTIEHLTATVGKRVSAAKKAVVGKKSASAKRVGAGVVRYRDPETGATWTGFGRAPAWIAAAEDREVFAVDKSSGRAPAK
jgi:DNA-binding protein H-NS